MKSVSVKMKTVAVKMKTVAVKLKTVAVKTKTVAVKMAGNMTRKNGKKHGGAARYRPGKRTRQSWRAIPASIGRGRGTELVPQIVF